MAGGDDSAFSERQKEEIEQIAHPNRRETDHSLTDEQIAEIKGIVRQSLIEYGFEANGPETRKANIARTHFVDKMMSRFDSLSMNVGRAIVYALITAFLGLVWLGFKTKLLSGGG